MKKILLLTIAISAIQITNAQSTVGLQSNYTFNDATYNDQTGDNHGQNTNTVLAADRFGNTNKAAYFNSNAYVEVGDSSELDLNNMTAISISFWSKQTTFNSSLTAVISKWTNSASSEQYGVFAQNDDFAIAVGTVATNAMTVPTNIDTNWNHFVVVYDLTNTNITGYLNGVSGGTLPLAAFPGTSVTSSFVIGAEKNSVGQFVRKFNGYIDDIYVYNRAINQTDVNALYNAPNPATVGIDETNTSNNLQVYPNPTKNQLTINTNEQIQGITIIDVTGKTVETLINPSNTINVAELNNGIYFLAAKTKNGISYNRFIKE